MAEARPFEQGPYLTAALICEKVLVEQDGVKSAIRIFDRFVRTTFGPEASKEMKPFRENLTILLIFKAGKASGAHKLAIRMVKPNAQTIDSFVQEIRFEGESEQGADLVITAIVEFDQEGVYWFETMLDNILLTKIPLRVIYVLQEKPE